MAIPGQNVDFSWIANLPATWDEAQSRADIRDTLSGLVESDPDSLDRAARALLRSGRDKSVQLGINLSALAQKRRELLQGEETGRTIGKFLYGSPTGTMPQGPAGAPTETPGIPQAPPAIQNAVQEHAARTGLDPALLTRQIYQESGFNPNATGGAGEKGVSQFTPATAKDYNVNTSDIADSVRGQADYMRDLSKKYSGNMGLALAAYNAGPKKVDDYLTGKLSALPQVTQDYVKNITGRTINDWQTQTPSVAQAAPVVRTQPVIDPRLQDEIARTSAAMGLPGIKPAALEGLKARLSFLYTQAAKQTPEEAAALARAQRETPPERAAGAAATTQATEEQQAVSKELVSLEDNARSADDILQVTGRMKNMMDRPEFMSGFGTTHLAGAASGVLSAANLAKATVEAAGQGVPSWLENTRQDLTKRVRLAEDFAAARNTLTFNLAHGKLSQGFTDKDREFVNNINAGPETSVAGNRALLETARAKAAYDKELAGVARQYRKDAGPTANPTGLGQALADYRAKNPLFVDKDGELTTKGKQINDISFEDQPKEAPKTKGRTITSADEGKVVLDRTGKRVGTIKNGEFVPDGGQ